MEVGKTLRVTTRKAWRTWLAKNHASRKEIWLAYPLKHTGKRRISYNDAVEEPLCFGWIDSIIKKVDADTLRSGSLRDAARRATSPRQTRNACAG
jgi:uncharacterized protein YdeI (YjbR/CyaY-like superfamily)